ncbi:hypothetical protein IPG36_08010 [bacterium]|nr:MAG: hypothetical protein IPG36_08010 [bacterium]
MRSMIVKFRNSRIEFWLSLATLALFVYTFIAQRRTNIYALCRIDPINTMYGSGYYKRSMAAEDVERCIGARQNDLLAAWAGPFAWALIVTVVVMSSLLGMLYVLARYTNWLGNAAGLRPVIFFNCGCGLNSCAHCRTGLHKLSTKQYNLLLEAPANEPEVSTSTGPRRKKPLTFLRFFPRGKVMR